MHGSGPMISVVICQSLTIAGVGSRGQVLSAAGVIAHCHANTKIRLSNLCAVVSQN